MNSLMRFQGVYGENRATGGLLADAEALSVLHPKAASKTRSTLMRGLCLGQLHLRGSLKRWAFGWFKMFYL